MVRYAVVALVFLVGSASAAAYDDYFRGVEAMRAGDVKLAISSYSSALTAGDLAPAYVPNAYVGRAQAYLQTQQCASALADVNAALKLRPQYLDAYMVRARANGCLGNADAALADLNAALAISPIAPLYRMRGDFHWYRGEFAPAADDYAQAFKLAPKASYNLLWFAISAARAGTFDATAFAKKVSALDADDWPAPLLDFMRGKETVDAVYKAAAEGDAGAATNQKCEADFYVAEWQLGSNAAAAKTLLQQAVTECPHNFVEYRAAREDIKRVP